MLDARSSLLNALAKSILPPEKLSYSEWARKSFRLSGNSAAPGKFRPWKPQRGLLDAMGDPLLPRVDVIKATRTGYTTCLVAAIGADAVNDPSPIMLLMPTDDDARGIMVDEVDPAFRDTPALKGLMKQGRMDGRNTLTQRTMVGGGSLKVNSARSPRNLRRHTVKKLYVDEVDGMEITKEGDPVKLAEKRTTSYADRKIITGSTPTDDEASIIVKRYEASDQRIFEVPCPHCSERFEILWEHIRYEGTAPESAVCDCPLCGCEIEERFKPEMVEAGEWRATKPEVKGHAGFRWNALISLFANAAWHILAKEFEDAKRDGFAAMQVFYNTVLGKVWSSSINYVGENELMARVEAFGIEWLAAEDRWREDIPAEVIYLTVGIDVQVDRLECTIMGWTGTQRVFLGHHVIMGPTNLQSTWDECDAFLLTRWQHPLGGEIGIEAAGIDAGDGNRTQYVYDFTSTKLDRKVVAIKGVGGAKPIISISRSRHKRYHGATFFNIGVDQIKTDILVTLPVPRINKAGEESPQAFRFSDSLPAEWFRQITSERRQVKYKHGKPKIEFVRIENRQAEALDGAVYAIAVKSLCKFDYDARRIELAGKPAAKAAPDLSAIASRLNG
ncbi:hypothetical protein JP75_06575 [Devosia riboflavina]|uniref:Terminase n=2 Tax=Devosia riboflavina TaxID=46914 RepID=A0A087M4C6_9HYPH|nr:hypothetical protein JP75_06575 [Devosia riboflavina]